jgi:hypothetical protein
MIKRLIQKIKNWFTKKKTKDEDPFLYE